MKSYFMVLDIQKNPLKCKLLQELKRNSKSVAFGRGGSSPPTGTIHRKVAFIAAFRRFGPPKISSIVRFPIQLAQQILWKLVVYSDY